jgi:ubiquinone/menaquinone biosynthesis C-methylase UbiE
MGELSNYGRLADVYDFLVNIWSLGQTRASKMSQLKHIKPGQRVLAVGAGAGEEIAAIARAGAHVTVVELAAPMVELIRGRLDKAGLLDRATLIAGDIMQHQVPDHERYDVVTANFLFAAFHKTRFPAVLEHLMGMIKPGGQLLIADYAPMYGSLINRFFQAAYYGLGNVIVTVTAGNVLHRPYEPPANWYVELFEKANFTVEPVEYFRMGGVGPRWVRCWAARKPLSAGSDKARAPQARSS